MTKRKTIRQEHRVDIEYDSVSEAIETLKGIKEEHGDVTLFVDTEEDYGAYYARVYFETTREETDAELEGRLASEQLRKNYRRDQYLKLKEEFEGEES